MILLALISLNLPQPWPDLSNTVVFLYFKSAPFGKYVTGNASRARAELGLVLNTCLDMNKTNKVKENYSQHKNGNEKQQQQHQQREEYRRNTGPPVLRVRVSFNLFSLSFT